MKRLFFDFSWIFILALVVLYLSVGTTREQFIYLTSNYPVMMGFVKFAILATMGELLARRVIDNNWTFKNIGIFSRMFIWGLLGILFTYVFPIYSAGIDALVATKRLYVSDDVQIAFYITAFWKSFWMNILFAFPFMVSHRFTDMLIDRGLLYTRWPFFTVWMQMDWKNLWTFVAPTILWFWVPAHTITFIIPSEFRIIMAAGLSICLGGILGFAKKKAKNQ